MKLKRINIFLIVLSLVLSVFSSCAKKNNEDAETTDETVNDMEYKLEMPSEELQKKFEEEYRAYHNHYDYSYEVAIEKWYGSFGDIGFLFVKDAATAYPQAYLTVVVAGIEFQYSDYHTIEVWVDGAFMGMDKAYEQNKITKEMVEKIAEVYRKGEGIKVYDVYKSSEN